MDVWEAFGFVYAYEPRPGSVISKSTNKVYEIAKYGND